MIACPHCGLKLPAVVDAYCPDCRERLDDPPDRPDPASGGKGGDRGRWPKRATLLGAVVGLAWALARSEEHAGGGAAFVVGFVCGGVVFGGLIGTLAGFLWMAGRAHPEP